jgi:hypothetical protein
MEKQTRLSEKQMADVVAEVSRLSLARAETLERRQVEDILRDLNLPTDLYDDAIAQLNRRESLAREQRRNRWLIAAAAAGLLCLLVFGYWWYASRAATFAAITGERGRITRAADDGASLSTLTRNGADAVYHVTLRNVPLNQQLNLSCQWVDPNGQVFKINNWQTRATDKSVWVTSCKCQLGAAATAGQWKVKMQLGDRTLSETAFQVE